MDITLGNWTSTSNNNNNNNFIYIALPNYKIEYKKSKLKNIYNIQYNSNIA